MNSIPDLDTKGRATCINKLLATGKIDLFKAPVSIISGLLLIGQVFLGLFYTLKIYKYTIVLSNDQIYLPTYLSKS